MAAKKRTVKPDECTVAQVAQMVGTTYQRARDMMTRGAFGKSEYDATTRSLTVKRSGVVAFLRQARGGSAES
jgi:hypothetical protein